jgi:hypothetical protein
MAQLIVDKDNVVQVSGNQLLLFTTHFSHHEILQMPSQDVQLRENQTISYDPITGKLDLRWVESLLIQSR